MKPNHVKNSDFMSILYSKRFKEYNKPKFGIGHRIRISNFELPLSKSCYKPQFTGKVFKNVAIATEKPPPRYTIKDEQKSYTRESLREGND